MKRYGNLWPKIIDFENLMEAARKAQKGKRFQENVLRFNYNREDELIRLHTELSEKTYQPGPYTTFDIYEPKRRMISAAPYRDRVVHHALCNIVVPLVERSFIDDSYANRLGYGVHRGLRRFIQFMRSSRYVLQCDLAKYFPSIDHEILKAKVRRKIKCPDTLWLIDRIIDNSNEQIPFLELFPGDDLHTLLQRRRGLPIGNLTSQFFANFYLNDFDHYVREQLKIGKYLRYVDDFALFSDDHGVLAAARCAIEDYLDTLRLRIHPVKSQLFETCHGASFLGFRVMPKGNRFPKEVCLRVRSGNLRRARRRLKQLQEDYAKGKIELADVDRSVQSWIAHLDHGDTWRLRSKVFADLVFSRR